MVEYSKINCKLTNIQLNKLKKSNKSKSRSNIKIRH